MKSGLLGGLLVGILGVLVPPTMFWGEFEIRSLADPSHQPLPHIWPPGGIRGLAPFLGGHYSAGEHTCANHSPKLPCSCTLQQASGKAVYGTAVSRPAVCFVCFYGFCAAGMPRNPGRCSALGAPRPLGTCRTLLATCLPKVAQHSPEA